jgi:hypothetical protein
MHPVGLETKRVQGKKASKDQTLPLKNRLGTLFVAGVEPPKGLVASGGVPFSDYFSIYYSEPSINNADYTNGSSLPWTMSRRSRTSLNDKKLLKAFIVNVGCASW